MKDESPNDRNDRAIRVAVKWYSDHLKGQPVRTVLLSDDRANREKAGAIGLKAVSGKKRNSERKLDSLNDPLWLVKDYVEGIKDVPELLDIVVAPKDSAANKNEIIYEEVRNIAFYLTSP